MPPDRNFIIDNCRDYGYCDVIVCNSAGHVYNAFSGDFTKLRIFPPFLEAYKDYAKDLITCRRFLTAKDLKRKWCISWDQLFMGVAMVTSQRSKDPNRQVGSCIVNCDNRVVSTGYNGMPNGCEDSVMPWGRKNEDNMKNKTLYVCHSELNAILNTPVSVKGCTIYVTLFPCNDCAKAVIQAGIKEVVYYSDCKASEQPYIVSRRMMRMAGVKTRKYVPVDMTMRIGHFYSKL